MNFQSPEKTLSNLCNSYLTKSPYLTSVGREVEVVWITGRLRGFWSSKLDELSTNGWQVHQSMTNSPFSDLYIGLSKTSSMTNSQGLQLAVNILREMQDAKFDGGYEYDIRIDPNASKETVKKELAQVAADAMAQKLQLGHWGDAAIVLKGFYAAYKRKFASQEPSEALQRLRNRTSVPGKPPVRHNPSPSGRSHRPTPSRPRGRG